MIAIPESHDGEEAKFPESDNDSNFPMSKNADDDRRTYWTNQLMNFLIKSNEKWILDQFNLCKKFLNQNSIQGHYDDFSHPAYDDFGHIRSMKAKCSSREGLMKFRKHFTNLVKMNSVDDVEKRDKALSSVEEIPAHRISDIDLNVLKCDILALLKTIEEIENKVKMTRILTTGKTTVSSMIGFYINPSFY